MAPFRAGGKNPIDKIMVATVGSKIKDLPLFLDQIAPLGVPVDRLVEAIEGVLKKRNHSDGHEVTVELSVSSNSALIEVLN